MDLVLKGKIVVVTGAAGIRGSIGETIIQELANEGAIPVIIDRNDRGFVYESELREKGVDSLFVKADVMEESQLASAFNTIKKKYPEIHALINNVGVNDSVGLDASGKEFIDSIKLNLVSCFLATKYALPLIKKGEGSILNIGSKVAYTGQGNTSGYAASKGGVMALTREWAVDLVSQGIRSNCIIIAESWTPAYDTWIRSLSNGQEKLESIVKKIPFENRMTTPLEIASNALFLISEKSSHTTGQHLFVDGGYVHLDRSLLTDQL